MMNSEILLKKPSTQAPKWIVWGFAALSFIGFLDVAYLATKHYLGTALNCPFFGNCEQVTASQYAVIGGVPVALLGAIYYLIVFILAIAHLDSENKKILHFIAYFTILGFLASLWFLYLQLFVIGAICLYCVLSAITSTVLFTLGLVVIKKSS